MMCEASENEVDVNQHPSLSNDIIDDRNSMSKSEVVSQNVNHANNLNDSPVNKDKIDNTSEKYGSSDQTRQIVDESNMNAPSENDSMAEQTINETQQHVHENSHNKVAESNGLNCEQVSETAPNQEMNGHSNGIYKNDHNQEIKENHNGSGM